MKYADEEGVHNNKDREKREEREERTLGHLFTNSYWRKKLGKGRKKKCVVVR